MKLNEELIEKLKNGKITVRNDGTKEHMRKVLKAAFPKDIGSVSLHLKKFGFSKEERHDGWIWIRDANDKDIKGEVISVKEFFVKETIEVPIRILRELRETGAEAQHIIDAEYPNEFGFKLDVGEWYKNQYGCLFNFNGGYDLREDPCGYGVDINKKWVESEKLGWGQDGLEKATPEEVKDALVAEAEKRGFKEGVTINNSEVYNQKTDNDILTKGYFLFNKHGLHWAENENSWWSIFKDGKWAEIIEPTITTQTETIVEIEGKKFKVTLTPQ